MKKVLIALALIGAIAFAAYKYVFRGTKDLSDAKAEQVLDFAAVNGMFAANDSTKLKALEGKVIAVSGAVKSIDKQDSSATVIIGDTTGMNTITCQIDNRHLAEAQALNAGAAVKCKGECTGSTIDEMLGGDLQLKGCVVEK
jgi:hypothetical protein